MCVLPKPATTAKGYCVDDDYESSFSLIAYISLFASYNYLFVMAFFYNFSTTVCQWNNKATSRSILGSRTNSIDRMYAVYSMERKG